MMAFSKFKCLIDLLRYKVGSYILPDRIDGVHVRVCYGGLDFYEIYLFSSIFRKVEMESEDLIDKLTRFLINGFGYKEVSSEMLAEFRKLAKKLILNIYIVSFLENNIYANCVKIPEFIREGLIKGDFFFIKDFLKLFPSQVMVHDDKDACALY